MDLQTWAHILFGMYLTVCLMLGIGLTTKVILHNEKSPTQLMRVCGWAMLCDGFLLVIREIIYNYYPSTFLTILTNCLDNSIEILICIAAETLVLGTFPSKKNCAIYAAPYFLLLLVLCIFHQSIGNGFYWAFFAVSSCICIHIFTRLYKYHKNLKDCLSNTEGYTAHWFVVLSMALLVELVLWIISNTAKETLLEWLSVYALIMIVNWILLFYFAVSQKTLKPEDLTEEKDVQKSEAKDSTYGISVRRLETLLVDERIFLNPDITVDTMVEMLNTNRYAFSNYIHNTLGTNFFDFINSYRIEEAKYLLKSTDQKIEDVALKSGFNSSRAFLRVFKSFTGQTPREWRKQLQQEQE